MVLTSYLQYASLILVSNLVDPKKITWIKLAFMIALGGTVGYTVGKYLQFNAIFIELPLIVGFFFFQTREVWNSLMRVLSAYIILIISDHITSAFFYLLGDITLSETNAHTMLTIVQVIISSIVGLLIALLVSRLLNHFARKIEINQNYMKYGSILTFLTLVYYYISISFSQRAGNSPAMIMFNAISFIVYFIAISFILVIVIISARRAAEVRSEKERHERLQLYSESLENMNMEIRKFKHDYLNILSTMSSYINDGNLDDLRAYFLAKIIPTKDILLESNNTIDNLKNLAVVELKGIISYKAIQAQQQGVKIIIEIPEVVEYLNMDEIDMCRSLGIILDNAIEEAALQTQGQVNIGFFKKEHSILIVVMNTCREPVNIHKISIGGYSTKGSGRGLGLNNFKEIMEKYENIISSSEMRAGSYIQEIEIFN